jgi:hypothetical protein
VFKLSQKDDFGLLELKQDNLYFSSGIFSTPDVMVILSKLGLLILHSGISSILNIMVIQP